jgi:hypothetical protein
VTASSDRSGGDLSRGAEAVPAPRSESATSSLSGCDLLEDVAAELALGSLTGAERSYALTHLDECQSCRQLVEELTAAADSLLLIAAEADPPAGFEVRLLARLKSQGGTGASLAGRSSEVAPLTSVAAGQPRSAGRFTTRVRVVLAAAAVAMAAAGVGLGLEVAPRAAPSISALGPFRVAALHAVGASSTSRGSSAGEIAITAAQPSWLLMSVNLDATGQVTCEVDVNGREVSVGTFDLYAGRGTWGAALREPGAVTSARIVSSNGQVLATADLHS